MRRYAYIICFLLVLVTPFVLRLVLVKGSTPGTATGGDALTLVVVSPHNDDIRLEFSTAFSAWHLKKYGREVKLDFRTVGTSDVKRLIETTYREIKQRNGNALPTDEKLVRSGLDVVWGGGDYMFDRELKPLGVLRPIELDPKLMAEVFPQPTLAGVKLYDFAKDAAGKPLPPRWIGVCLSSFGIVYNPDIYRTLGLAEPATWNDLADPKLIGLISLADPQHSGSAAVAYMMVIQRAMADAETAFLDSHPDLKARPKAEWSKNAEYKEELAAGWKRGLRVLTQIAANTRYFADSSTIVPNDVGNGEAAAGVAIDFYGRVTQESLGSDRCRFVSPRAATAITPDPIAILYGTTGEKLTLANHLVEFLLTREAQLLWILNPGQKGGPSIRSLRRPPIRFDLYAANEIAPAGRTTPTRTRMPAASTSAASG